MAPINESSGVYKKILSQAKAFTSNGYNCKILFLKDCKIAYLRELDGSLNELDIEDNNTLKNIKTLILACNFCYVRYELLRHHYFRKILQLCILSHRPIITEIPTYPPYQESLARVRESWNSKKYKQAIKTLLGSLCVIVDLYIYTLISKLIVVVGDDKKFLFSNTVRIENGIDLKSNPYFKEMPNSKVLRVIAVSNFSVWNGYDRAILGLKKYIEKTKKHDIRLVLVGDKKAGSSLLDLARGLGVSEDVEFTDSLSGEKLDREYKKASLALGALGNHRRKVFENSSLKVKEYCSRGMLMILSDAEGVEPDIKNRSYMVKSNEEPIDFVRIKQWYNNIEDKEKYREFISQFARCYYSWDSQVCKIINNFNVK